MVSIFEESKSYRPFKYPWLMEAVERHNIDMFWDKHQLDFSDDYKQYHSKDGLATENVSHEVNKNVLTKVLNLFTQMDVAAGELYCSLLSYTKNNEVRNWFMAAANKEGTHQRCYAAAVEALEFPESSWTEFMEFKEMQDKLDIMYGGEDTHPSTKKGYMKTLVRLAMGEGICLFGAFATMLNQRRFGKIQGTNKVNEWSLKDEEEHVTNNLRIFLSELKNFDETDRREILDYVGSVVQAYVDAEHTFLDLVYEIGDQDGMTKQDAKDYICYLADLRLETVGLPPIYGFTENPLPWMDWVLSGKKHTNFFEERVADYSHEPLKGSINYEKYEDAENIHGDVVKEKSETLTVYSTGWCSYCTKLKTFLDENLIDYNIVDVDELESFEFKTIPQVFEGEKHLGGYTDTVKYFTE